jgi:hypothetical protein
MRQVGHMVSPFEYQVQQFRQTARLNDAPCRDQRAGSRIPSQGKLEAMSLARTLMRFIFLAAIGHQITYTVVEGGIFEDARRRVSGIHPKASEFIHCHLCVGTWIGLVLAGIYRPNLLADVDNKPAAAARQLANVAGDAFLIALGTRVWNEGLGWLRREVQVKQQTIEAAESAGSEASGLPGLPGISIRAARS